MDQREIVSVELAGLLTEVRSITMLLISYLEIARLEISLYAYCGPSCW